MKILLIIGACLIVVVSVWLVVDSHHKFRNKIPPSTIEEIALFQNPEDSDILRTFRDNFYNPKFQFPRMEVYKIKLYKNNFLQNFTSKTLQQSYNDSMVSFFNDPNNFDWGETTWQRSEAEYILKFLDDSSDLVGQIYLIISEGGYLDALPFTPNMKFGRITPAATDRLTQIFEEEKYWN